MVHESWSVAQAATENKNVSAEVTRHSSVGRAHEGEMLGSGDASAAGGGVDGVLEKMGSPAKYCHVK